MPDTYDSILSLRAIRDYEDRPLDNGDLTGILEAARWTGSAKNRQNWSFVVVTGERLHGLAEHGNYTEPIRDSAATVVLVQEPGGNMFDMGRAAQNIMLAAEAKGVASCPVTLHRDRKAREFLEAPADRIARYAVALGYPAATAKPRRHGGRKSPDSVIRHDRY